MLYLLISEQSPFDRNVELEKKLKESQNLQKIVDFPKNQNEEVKRNGSASRNGGVLNDCVVAMDYPLEIMKVVDEILSGNVSREKKLKRNGRLAKRNGGMPNDCVLTMDYPLETLDVD